MKRLFKLVLVSLLALLAAAVGGFLLWAETPARPGAAALAALQSDARVSVFEREGYILFAPNETAPRERIALIFYPGGRVDYRAYAPPLRKIAEQGILVFLLRVRLNLAFFDVEAGAPLLQNTEGVTLWAAGGHSLGGVAASLFAQNHPEVRGVVFWASYPASEAFRATGLPVLSLYGTRDGLAPPEEIEQSRALLPPGAQLVAIQGGNHAQFGDYGFQNGDLPAELPAERQWQQIAQATVSFLQTLLP